MPFLRRIWTRLGTRVESVRKRFSRRQPETQIEPVAREASPAEANVKTVLKMLTIEEEQMDHAHKDRVVKQHNMLFRTRKVHEGTDVPFVTGKLRADKLLLDTAIKMARLKEEFFDAEMEKNRN